MSMSQDINDIEAPLKRKTEEIVLLQHSHFGYFTGHGWSAKKEDARRMNVPGAESWLRMFRDLSFHEVPFDGRLYVVVKEKSAEDTAPTIVHTRIHNHAMDVRTDWVWD